MSVLSVDIPINSPENMEKQLNPFVKSSHDRGTLLTDSTHDETNPNFKKTATHDDDIFTNTCLTTATCINNNYKPVNGQSIFDNPSSYIGEEDPPSTGYMPDNNSCYICDSHSGSILKGINNMLDSASTPKVTDFIENMITFRGLPTVGAPITYNYTSITGLTKLNTHELYKFVFFNSKLNQSLLPPVTPTKNLDYTAFSNYDVLFFIHVIKNKK
jgi:hypothetical protein